MTIIQNVIIYTVATTFILLNSGCTKKARVPVRSDDPLYADRGFTFPPGFPPDPGEAGEKAIAGIDSDHDGIRDDIQRWIYARYSNDVKKQKAMGQYAKGYFHDLNTQFTMSEFDTVQLKSQRARECMISLFVRNTKNQNELTDDFGMLEVEGEYLTARILNTLDRSKKYLDYDAHYDGMVFRDVELKEPPCDP